MTRLRRVAIAGQPLRARVDEIEMEIAALYAEIEELHRKVDAP